MSSYPRIENESDGAVDTEEEFVFPDTEEGEEEAGQQVDSFRVARISRAIARWAGALSETPQRSDNA